VHGGKFDDIPELTPFNFLENVGKSNVVAFFFAPWCGGCKKLIPQWEEVHSDLRHVKSKVTVMKANVTQFDYDELKGRLNISRVPAVRYFAKEDGPDATPSTIHPNEAWKMGFAIKEKLGMPTPNKCMFGDSEAQDIVSSEWDKTVNDASKSVLVEFYAPWCGHCKKFKTTYNLIAARFRRMKNSNLVAYRVNADVSKDLMSKYNVKMLPSFFVFPSDNKTGTPFKMYKEGSSSDTVEHVVRYMLRNATKERQATLLLDQLNQAKKDNKDTASIMDLLAKHNAELNTTDVWRANLAPIALEYRDSLASEMKDEALKLFGKADHNGALKLLKRIREEFGDTKTGASEAISNIYDNVVHAARN